MPAASIVQNARVAVPRAVADVMELIPPDVERVLGPGVVGVTPMSYDDRPFSHLARASVTYADDRPATAIYLKIFKAGGPDRIAKMRARTAHEFETTARTFAHLSGRSGLGVVRPVSCYPQHLAIVTEETPGATLLARLERDAAGFPSEETLGRLDVILSRTGQWLRAFQSMPMQPGATSEGLADYIDVRLRRLVNLPAAKVTADDRSAILEHVNRLDASVRNDCRVAVHADFAPGNVLVAGDRVVVLDFAMAATGDPLLDIARLYMQVDLLRLKPQFRARTIRRALSNLLRGYDPTLDSATPAFRLQLLRHHVNHLNTLAAGTARFPSSAYNAYVRRFHRRWMAEEVATGARGRS
jgi:hypothetical protein